MNREFEFELEYYQTTGERAKVIRHRLAVTATEVRSPAGVEGHFPDMPEAAGAVRGLRDLGNPPGWPPGTDWHGAIIIRYCHPQAVPLVILPRGLEARKS
jgi:hypothetical protein